MRTNYLFIGALAGALLGTGCNKSGTAAGGGAPTSADRAKEHLENAGQELKSAATEAASEVKPALERAKEEGRDVLHGAATKVAQWTTTQPGPPDTAPKSP